MIEFQCIPCWRNLPPDTEQTAPAYILRALLILVGVGGLTACVVNFTIFRFWEGRYALILSSGFLPLSFGLFFIPAYTLETQKKNDNAPSFTPTSQNTSSSLLETEDDSFSNTRLILQPSSLDDPQDEPVKKKTDTQSLNTKALPLNKGIGNADNSSSTDVRTVKEQPVGLPIDLLPSLHSKIPLSNAFELNIATETLRISGAKASFGAVTDSCIAARELAFLLQKNKALVEEVMQCGNTQAALKELADAIRQDLPSHRIAGLCVLDHLQKTYSVEIFGDATLGVRVQPEFGYSGICDHSPELECGHNEPPFKLQLLRLTLYTKALFDKPGIFRTRHHDHLPDNHWIHLRIFDANYSVEYPHPDHLDKTSAEINKN